MERGRKEEKEGRKKEREREERKKKKVLILWGSDHFLFTVVITAPNVQSSM